MDAGGALASAWIPFAVVSVLIIIFSFFYIRFYQSKYDSELSTSLTAMFALAITLFTTALTPVDIFLASFMKESNGTFKDWASSNETRSEIENSVLYTYYAFYGCIALLLFFLLPFMYFFYEEKDDDIQPTCCQRACGAIKFTVGFLVVFIILILVGTLAPFRDKPSSNMTDWQVFEFLFKEWTDNRAEDALSFVISALTLIGFLALITYTAYGMSALPMNLIKGSRSARKERLEVRNRQRDVRDKIEAIRDKYRGNKPMSRRDRQKVAELEESELLINRQERHLETEEKSLINKCLLVLRPFQIVFGVVFILVALLIFLSLLLTNIDKAMHSLGYKYGYSLSSRKLPNPIDIVLVWSEKVFPIDYVLMGLIIAYFFFCSVAGIRNMGIWFLWIRMYKIRPRRTRPQALLFMCMILMYIVLAINVMIYEITPDYSTYGSQHYLNANNTISRCSTEAPPSECTMTRMSTILTLFFYKVWLFGAAYYWASWAFLGVFVIGAVVAVVKGRRSAIDGQVDEEDFDSDDDDDRLLRP